MWIGQQSVKSTERGEQALLSLVTQGGTTPAVFAGGEARQTTVVGPGCYWWVPKTEETALVLWAGEETAEVCLAGREQGQPPVTLGEGEALLACGSSYIHLKADGTILLHGSIVIEGSMVYQSGS